MWIALIILCIIFLIVRKYNRTNNYYEVVDQKGNSKTLGNYYQCKSWINTQQGMESLTGKINNYTINKKKFKNYIK